MIFLELVGNFQDPKNSQYIMVLPTGFRGFRSWQSKDRLNWDPISKNWHRTVGKKIKVIFKVRKKWPKSDLNLFYFIWSGFLMINSNNTLSGSLINRLKQFKIHLGEDKYVIPSDYWPILYNIHTKTYTYTNPNFQMLNYWFRGMYFILSWLFL